VQPIESVKGRAKEVLVGWQSGSDVGKSGSKMVIRVEVGGMLAGEVDVSSWGWNGLEWQSAARTSGLNTVVALALMAGSVFGFRLADEHGLGQKTWGGWSPALCKTQCHTVQEQWFRFHICLVVGMAVHHETKHAKLGREMVGGVQEGLEPPCSLGGPLQKRTGGIGAMEWRGGMEKGSGGS
jgi:hypothetical protein